MYHCHVYFYFVGCHNVFEVIKRMMPLPAFTHEFLESDRLKEELAEKADVIFAHMQDGKAEKFQILKKYGEKAQIILIEEKEVFPAFSGEFEGVQDIWNLPMTEEEIRFRFLRWQQTYKMSKDFWQTDNYLESAINSSPNLIWYKDKNGIHEKVNDSFCKTVNKKKSEVEGRGHAYIWNVEEDDPACIESEREVMSTGKTCVSEETIMTGEGIRLLTTYKSPLYDVDGSVMGTVGVAIDSTKERAYEKEIIRKNQALEAIFTTMDCGVITHALEDGRILSVNRAALEISGYESVEELMEQGFQVFSASVVEADRQVFLERMESLRNEGDSVSLEYRICHRNGDIIHLMGNAKVVLENGEYICQQFFLDCTAQKEREEQERVADRQRQMELIQALSIDYNLVCLFYLSTKEGMLLQKRDRDGSVLGNVFSGEISLEKNMHSYIEEFVYEEDKEMVFQAMDKKQLEKELTEKGILYVNYRARIDGEIQYYQIKAVRTGKWGTDKGVVVGIRSVDEEVREEMEKNLLLEDALLQANRANKAKSIFLSNMSHDIRTPMNAIVGFTNLAMSHLNSQEKVEEYLKKIMTSGNHLLSLINDILDMSRIESGKMQLEEAPCSLPEILYELRNILQADIRAKQLELQLDAVDVVNEEVYCDRLRLNQVLLNLLGNSVKFTPAGGTVSLRLAQKPGARAGYANYEFYIKDTGVGMSKEFADHIFEPFTREKTSTVSGIQGTGLGMAITKNIVDMMHGDIWVESMEGEGTEFTLSLSLRLYSEAREDQTIPELVGCRALVVDDDFNSCDSVSYMLQQIGMRAEWTLSGKEAVLRTHHAAMRDDNYSLYIIDWLLPDMNGVEVARRIRKEIGEEVPILVLTSYDWADIEEEAREAGVTSFCSKPLFLSELRKCLHTIVKEPEEPKNDNSQKNREHGTGRILLAEDNELNQEIAETILTEAGFAVEIAGNGQEAVKMVEKSKPGYYQLVLMDVRMPVMDGYEATRKIRAMENRKLASIPIIAMTANAFKEDKEEAARQGMDAHIAKPIDIEILFETLEKVFS